MSGNPPEIEKIEGVRFSDEGRTVHLLVKLAGRPAELTMPSASLPDIHARLGGAIDALRDAGILPPAPQSQVQGINVTTAKVRRGGLIGQPRVAILINDAQPHETMLVCTEFSSLKLADDLQMAVFQGMSLDAQKKLLEDVERASGRRPGIIMPSGRRPH